MTIWQKGTRAGAALLMLLCVSMAQGQEHGGGTTEHHKKNMIAVFLGGATEDRRDKGIALGIEYERRLSESWGIGLVAERTFGDFNTNIFAVPFAFHSGHWKTYLAPGIEDGEEGSEHLIRVGIEYGFIVGKWEVSPQFDFDFVDGDRVAVLGVVFGIGF